MYLGRLHGSLISAAIWNVYVLVTMWPHINEPRMPEGFVYSVGCGSAFVALPIGIVIGGIFGQLIKSAREKKKSQ